LQTVTENNIINQGENLKSQFVISRWGNYIKYQKQIIYNSITNKKYNSYFCVPTKRAALSYRACVIPTQVGNSYLYNGQLGDKIPAFAGMTALPPYAKLSYRNNTVEIPAFAGMTCSPPFDESFHVLFIRYLTDVFYSFVFIFQNLLLHQEQQPREKIGFKIKGLK
jgi:hypothetical protein